VWETAKPNELEAHSYLLLSRSRYEQSQLQIMSCVRYDLLRRSGPGAFKLARREIILDQSVLGMANLAVFL
jgi:3-phenylpropionate/cinnamic acid dioxygenase small subunit